jgi:hypothetical protein
MLARLYQHDRECDGKGAPRLSEHEAMASIAMRWTADMQEAAKGFRRLKAHKQLPAIRRSGSSPERKNHAASLFTKPTPLNINLGSDRFSMFNKERDNPI